MMLGKIVVVALLAVFTPIALAYVAPSNLHHLVSNGMVNRAVSDAPVLGRVPLRSPQGQRQMCPTVMMAKAKKGGKGKKGGGGGGGDSQVETIVVKKVDTAVNGADTKTVVKNVKEKMSKTVENTREALGAIRTGRPSPNIFDKVMVEYYGAETPLPQVATVQIQSASMISIEPYEASSLKDVERAILASDLGLTPNNDGTVIRINIPALTAETRQQYLKQAKALAEDGKVALRNIRRTGVDAVKKLEKDAGLSEDESKGTQDDIQKMTDANVKAIDGLCEAKEKELSKV